MPKIILVTPAEEIKVGTIKSPVEAFQCAALLQALTTTDNYTYYVEHWYKGKKRRTQPSSIIDKIRNCKTLYDLIKPLYI